MEPATLHHEPRYHALHRDGRLAALARRLEAALAECRLCPRRCGVDRRAGGRGRCSEGAEPRIAAAYPHFGEEPCLVGRGGSGTVFFTGCGLGCRFCQNDAIRRGDEGIPREPAALADVFLALQEAGCENLNLVTPTHHLPGWVRALDLSAARGLRLPVAYNTGGYEEEWVVDALEGVVDVWLPDFKTRDPERARRWMDAPDYPQVAEGAIRRMVLQSGVLRVDSDGVARRGVLVRHLVMPGAAEDTLACLRAIASMAPGMAVSLMDQYRPVVGDPGDPDLLRRPGRQEWEAALREARRLGLRGC
ncbi:MAG TPA: radical SAM protein [Myxococcota bacterium]|nr:radical SAM protein [Myxococcota bacterium]HQK50564.1 radical SAM protein [Myxococcota bacterium]